MSFVRQAAVYTLFKVILIPQDLLGHAVNKGALTWRNNWANCISMCQHQLLQYQVLTKDCWFCSLNYHPFQTLNPIFLMHSLCASMRSPQFSSPRSTMQASRTFFVSGQAQHGLSFFSSFGFSSGVAAIAALNAFPDIMIPCVQKTKKTMEKWFYVNFHFYEEKIM